MFYSCSIDIEIYSVLPRVKQELIIASTMNIIFIYTYLWPAASRTVSSYTYWFTV